MQTPNVAADPAEPEPLRGLRALVVEDEALIAEELRERLSRFDITVETADSAGAAIQRAVDERPDVILMDIRLRGDRDGIEAVKEIQRRMQVPVVYLTAYSDRATVERAKETLPAGYLLKPFRERDLRLTIEMAVHCHAAASAHATSSVAPDRAPADTQLTAEARRRYDRLTERQRQVFALVVQGRLNKQIAAALDTTERTVKAHRAQVMKRLGARSVAELARIAERLRM